MIGRNIALKKQICYPIYAQIINQSKQNFMKTSLLSYLSSFLLVFAFGFSVQAQSISGTVSDDNGVPLPGATVIVEGTQNGVSTDFDGNYSINASNGDTLVFSFVGYTNQSVVVGSSATVNVSLQPDNL